MCQRRADAAIQPEIRERWLKLAYEYERLATWMAAMEPLVNRRDDRAPAAGAEQGQSSRA